MASNLRALDELGASNSAACLQTEQAAEWPVAQVQWIGCDAPEGSGGGCNRRDQPPSARLNQQVHHAARNQIQPGARPAVAPAGRTLSSPIQCEPATCAAAISLTAATSKAS